MNQFAEDMAIDSSIIVISFEESIQTINSILCYISVADLESLPGKFSFSDKFDGREARPLKI